MSNDKVGVCECKIGWVADPSEEGTHNLVGVRCVDYITLLEERIRGMSSTDSDWLDRVQKNLVGLENSREGEAK